MVGFPEFSPESRQSAFLPKGGIPLTPTFRRWAGNTPCPIADVLHCAEAAVMIGRWFKRKDPPSRTRVTDGPDLPQQGFISGRAARVGDVDRGNAVFSQKTDDGETSEPYPIMLPQYGLWHSEGASPVPVIVVQAERHITGADGGIVFGMRNFNGDAIVAFGDEVELLGTIR